MLCRDGNGARSTVRARRSGAAATGKQSKKKGQRRQGRSFIGRPRKQGEATAMPFPRQREAKTATRAPGTPKKVAGGESASAVTVHSNYKFAIRQNSQITLKLS